MKKISVIVNGANGKMGSETIFAVKQDPALELIAALSHADNLGKTIQETKADCVIDFTTPSAVFENTKIILEHNARPIVGTTGLTADQILHLQQLAKEKKLGGLIAPNFSLGAVLMMQFSKQAAKFFPNVEIIEMHHEQKKDAPSGTAIKTAELIVEACDKTNKITIDCKESISGALGANYQSIPIHSIRLPGLVAHQMVLFGGHHETLTIRHDSNDRKSFMPGVILACHKVKELQSLIYGLEHLL